MKPSHGLIAAALLALAVPVSAQSLGEIAKREAERRKTLPTAVKTYTNEDLKKLPPMAGDTSRPAEQPAKAGDPAKPADAAVKPTEVKPDAALPPEAAKDEKYWRGRLTAVKEDIRRNETFRDALQVQINALAADFSSRDDPAARAKIADDRQKKLTELTRVTADIEKATKLITEIEDEARKAGVPPGWLR
jgi:hypothetical protein